MGIAQKTVVAMDAAGWENLRREIMETFTPGTPINETELFAGRQGTIQQLQDTVLEPGRHAIVYGERGVGKTSIANIFYRPLITDLRTVSAIRVNCDAQDTFDSLWRKVFRRIKRTHDGEVHWADEAHKEKLTPDDVVAELGDFGANDCPVVILDEFDRVTDDQCKILAADVIKGLSDFTVNCTVVIVGVAKSVTELIRNHESIRRPLKQVPMKRMTRDELADVVRVRLKRLGMTMSEDAIWRVTFFSSGLPFYTHLLGRHSCLRAVARKTMKVMEPLVYDAMQDCLAEVDQTVTEAYARGTEKIYRKENIFAQVLAACALADQNALGEFTATSVEAPLSTIMGKEYKSSHFGFHLNELSRPARGNIIGKDGERRTYRFRFENALMQPYIVMRSLQDGIITPDILRAFELKHQRSLAFSSAT